MVACPRCGSVRVIPGSAISDRMASFECPNNTCLYDYTVLLEEEVE